MGEGYQPPPTMDGNGHGQINFRGGSGTLMRRAVERTNMPITNVIEDGLPNARVASNIVSPDVEELKHPDGFSAAVWWIGQFLDHDLTFNKDVGADIFIDVTGDSHFDPSGEGDFISIRRGDFLFDHTGTRQFVNDITAFLDLSAVYGSRITAHSLSASTAAAVSHSRTRPTAMGTSRRGISMDCRTSVVTATTLSFWWVTSVEARIPS